jgi:calcineurin-like phosphoesterase family protein
MTKFFSSDPHFGHVRIIDLCERPFGSVDEMNQTILDNYNRACGRNDELWILGDVVMGSFAENLELLGQLEAGWKVMVSGNHDRTSLAYHHSKDPDKAAAKREQYYREYRRFFDLVLEDSPDLHMKLGEVSFAMSHYPYEGDSHGLDRHSELRPVDRGLPLIHGHVHGEWQTRGRQFNVGVDVNDFKPVPETKLVDWALGLSS